MNSKTYTGFIDKSDLIPIVGAIIGALIFIFKP